MDYALDKPINHWLSKLHNKEELLCQTRTNYLKLQTCGHSFSDMDVHILHTEERQFKQEMKDAIYLKREQWSLNQGTKEVK